MKKIFCLFLMIFLSGCLPVAKYKLDYQEIIENQNVCDNFGGVNKVILKMENNQYKLYIHSFKCNNGLNITLPTI